MLKIFFSFLIHNLCQAPSHQKQSLSLPGNPGQCHHPSKRPSLPRLLINSENCWQVQGLLHIGGGPTAMPTCRSGLYIDIYVHSGMTLHADAWKGLNLSTSYLLFSRKVFQSVFCSKKRLSTTWSNRLPRLMGLLRTWMITRCLKTAS